MISASAVERGHNVGTGSAAAAFEDALGHVGSFAAGHGTGLLVTVDEAQMAPQEDVSAVARALQTVVARRLQPVAVVFGGLQTFRERLAGAGTYASRLPVEELANLEPSAARLALVEPAARRHVAWEDEALGLLVRRSGGHPYYVQLFGWHAWEAAQGEATITLAHAKAGLRSARAELAGQYEVTWGRLRPQERDYLAAVASLAGTGGAGVEEVAKVLGKEPKQLAVARDRLVHKHGLLEVPERAQVRFVDAEMAAWVAERPDGTSTTTAVQRGPAPSAGRGRGRPSQLALSGRSSCPGAGGRAPSGPGPRALTPRAPGPGLRGQFGPAVLLAATFAISLPAPMCKPRPWLGDRWPGPPSGRPLRNRTGPEPSRLVPSAGEPDRLCRKHGRADELSSLLEGVGSRRALIK